MKWLKWPAGILLLLAVSAAAFRIFAPVQMLLTIAMVNRAMHRAAENHPVAWDQGPAVPASPADQRKPNIVVILADDLGFNDITAHGGGVANGAVPTPNIDSIAKDGVRLTNGYAGNATCAPSRAAIMTGRYGTRFGFEFTPAPVAFARVLARMATSAEPGHPAVFNNDVLENIPPLDTQALPPTEITIAAMLKQRAITPSISANGISAALRAAAPKMSVLMKA
ncbi:MAG TPA: sulfatase-like hydrolase/transferase [Myxococcota bacterium]|nr:sulfatase-like hydrolase/transferase [Myxococcota bacterium]